MHSTTHMNKAINTANSDREMHVVKALSNPELDAEELPRVVDEPESGDWTL